mgnify:FL=1
MSAEQRVYSIDDFKDVANEVFGNVLGRDEYKLEVYKRRKKRMVWGYIWLKIGMVNTVQFDKEDEQYMDMLIEIDKNRHITLGSIKSRKFAEWHGHDGDTLCTIYWREKNRTVRCLCEYYKLVIKFVRIDKDGVLIHFEAYEKVTQA